MPRDYEISAAFRQAIKRDVSGLFTVSTVDFVRELESYNWHWSLRDANKWIENYTTTFADISPTEGEARLFRVYNPNGGI